LRGAHATKQSEFVIAGRFDYSNGQIHMHSPVMAGLDPAIHVFVSQKESKTWMPGTRLRRGFDGLFSVPGCRSFSEGGKAGHDGLCYELHAL